MNVQLADSSIADRMIDNIMLQDQPDFFDRLLQTVKKAAPVAAQAAATYYTGGAIGGAGLFGGGQQPPQGGYAPPQKTNYTPFLIGGVALLAVVLLTQKK